MLSVSCIYYIHMSFYKLLINTNKLFFPHTKKKSSSILAIFESCGSLGIISKWGTILKKDIGECLTLSPQVTELLNLSI